MSEEYITEKIYESSNNQTDDNKSKNNYQIEKTEKSIKTETKKYKYVYTNINNKKIVTENSDNNIENNINNIPKRRILSSANLLNNDSPNDCETNYSINKI
jgi:hypothetical protein